MRATYRDYSPLTSYSLPVQVCPSCGQENPEGFRLCGMCGASLAPAPAAREERKVVTVLFCDLVGFTARAEQLDPEDVRRRPPSVPRPRPYGARALRRHRREVHRRRGDGALRGADRARGRPRARGPRGARDPRLRASRKGSSCASGSRPERRSSRSTRARPRARAWRRATSSTLPRGCRARRRSNGVLVDETTYRATRHAIEYERRVAGRGEGQVPADPGLGGDSGARSGPGVDVAHESALGARRPRAGARNSAGRARPHAQRANVAARDARRRAGHRQEPSRPRASPHRRRGSGAHHLAPGSLPRLRRRRHVVGAERDRQGAGRDPRAGSAGRGGREDPHEPSRS